MENRIHTQRYLATLKKWRLLALVTSNEHIVPALSRVRVPSEQDQIQQRYNDSSKCECDIFEEMFLSDEGMSQSWQIHSMDVQMAVFHCADGFLKQLMVTKLSQYKSTRTGRSETPTIKPSVKPIRFGSVSSSKSQLMNSLINEKHNTFFHRNCPGSSRNKSGTNDDKFTDCVAFCNLHGDAGDHEKRLQILTKISSVNVVLLPQIQRNDINMIKFQDLYKDSKPLICLLTENASTLIETRKGKYKIGLKDRNQSDVSEELRRAINACVSGPPSTFTLEDVSKYSDISVDVEDDDDCKGDDNNHFCLTRGNCGISGVRKTKNCINLKEMSLKMK
ncbi:Interferon-induced very large GTPase 1 [Labeo rohita]|uniref:Interferon-induced very large GTPase 1 n=1 Tax=Labeo rohita TaxID=84645 RepID=A0ABQ8LJQ6_LABRO|nr:Interferon-induced very large GTPase 1 [Labeo rohita]